MVLLKAGFCGKCLLRSTDAIIPRNCGALSHHPKSIGQRSLHFLRPVSLLTVLRRPIHTQEFKPFVPPAPTSLPKTRTSRTYPRVRKWSRRLIYLTLGGAIVYGVDQYFLYASVTRTMRTFIISLTVGLDYKINFRPHPWFVESLPALHARNAERLFSLLGTNGGLYLKIGQAIAMQVFNPAQDQA